MKKFLVCCLVCIFVFGCSVSAYAYYDYGYDDVEYTSEYDEEYDIGTTVLISVIVGFIVAFVSVSAMKAKLTTVKSEQYASNYIVNDSLNITHSDDIYLYRNTTRTARPKKRD